MDLTESLRHSKWNCKYHIIFIPTLQSRPLYEELRPQLGDVFRRFAAQLESSIDEVNIMDDHVHILISIPPKFAVSRVIEFIKGKSSIRLFYIYGENKQNFIGQHFWAKGYLVSTTNYNKQDIKEDILRQELEDKSLPQSLHFHK